MHGLFSLLRPLCLSLLKMILAERSEETQASLQKGEHLGRPDLVSREYFRGSGPSGADSDIGVVFWPGALGRSPDPEGNAGSAALSDGGGPADRGLSASFNRSEGISPAGGSIAICSMCSGSCSDRRKKELYQYVTENRAAFSHLDGAAYQMIQVMSHSSGLLKKKRKNMRMRKERSICVRHF